MSIKNQRPLIIFASMIIGLTVVSLFGLNLLVEHIANISPPSMPVVDTARPPMPNGVGADDALERPTPPMAMPPDFRGKPPRPDMMQRPKMPDMQRPPEDVMRRVRNGKDSPDLRRTQPRAPNGQDDAAQMQKSAVPGYPPPNMGNGYYPPPSPYQMPAQMDPQERERIEQEMERRREMYYGGPPPGYYPPPPYQPNDSYNGNYDYPYEYDDHYEDYDRFEDWDSKRESSDDDDEKTAENLGDYVYDQDLEVEADADIVEEYETDE